MLAIVGVVCLIIASFLSDLRIDATQAVGDYGAASPKIATEEHHRGQFSAEKDKGPYPDYYSDHLHWFVQVRHRCLHVFERR